jgi:hypothetical protein
MLFPQKVWRKIKSGTILVFFYFWSLYFYHVIKQQQVHQKGSWSLLKLTQIRQVRNFLGQARKLIWLHPGLEPTLLKVQTLFTHRKQSFSIFPSPAGMSLTKLSLGGNNDDIYKLFPPSESLASDIPAGEVNIEKLFYGAVFKTIGPCEQDLHAMARTWSLTTVMTPSFLQSTSVGSPGAMAVLDRFSPGRADPT